jgi:AcrR family transcriptional regulator
METETLQPRPAPRWRRRKLARPGEILTSALDSFVENGFEATRLEDIARRAGCTKGTIFLYYENKAELFKAAVREAMVPVMQAAEHTVEGHHGSARDLLESLLRQRWDRMTRSSLSGLAKLMITEAEKFPELARFYHTEVTHRTHALLARVLDLGIERGEFRPMDTANVARFAVSPILVAALWRHSFANVVEPPIQPEPFFEVALDVLFKGITAPAATS